MNTFADIHEINETQKVYNIRENEIYPDLYGPLIKEIFDLPAPQ